MPRRTTWVTTLFLGSTVATGAQFLVSLATSRSTTDSRGVTVVRTLLDLQFMSLSVAGAYAAQELFWGVGVASQEAFAAGVVPDPNSSADQPARGWMARGSLLVTQNGVGKEPVSRSQLDIRSARKLDEGEPYFVVNSVSQTATTFLTLLGGSVRQLWMMP